MMGRLLKTRHYGGKGIKKTDAIGHYIFCGKQRSGKTVSMLWYCERLYNNYKKKGKRVVVWSNMGIGKKVTKATISPIIRHIEYDPETYHIILLDELHSYFPKDVNDKNTKLMIDDLTGDFSQIAKKQIYVLSTAQVYGRINKNLREQCLFMVHCRKSKLTNKVVNDFIDGDDIICDDLGRWAGIPKFIMTHGLPKREFDTHQMITE